MNEIARARFDVQEECPHHEKNYQGDAAGGSETCELCGKDLTA